MAERQIVVGTRGSKLALWQANFVAKALQEKFNVKAELKIIKTTGDKILDAPLARIGGKGLFVKEIERALSSGEVDLAVHSMKDVPTELPEGLKISAMTQRFDPRDALISKSGVKLKHLPKRTRVGTSSLRRKAQLLHLRPDLEIVDVRGNLETRLRKMNDGQFEAIVLASAGLERMGFADLITELIDPQVSLSAVGQGSIGVETRIDDEEVNELVKAVNHYPTFQAITAERATLRLLEGGCQVPIGALGEVNGQQLSLQAIVASLDGRRLYRQQLTGSVEEAEWIGKEVGRQLIEQGAGQILEEIRQVSA